jgi:hypothetical protein
MFFLRKVICQPMNKKPTIEATAWTAVAHVAAPPISNVMFPLPGAEFQLNGTCARDYAIRG